MKVPVTTIIVDRDMVTKVAKQVFAWEVPVFEAKFGEGRIRVLEEAEAEVDELPDVDDEFARLVNAHGSDNGSGGTNVPYAEMAYGRGKAARTELQKAMQPKAKRKAKSKPKKAAPAKAAPVDDGDGDPLDFG